MAISASNARDLYAIQSVFVLAAELSALYELLIGASNMSPNTSLSLIQFIQPIQTARQSLMISLHYFCEDFFGNISRR